MSAILEGGVVVPDNDPPSDATEVGSGVTAARAYSHYTLIVVPT